MAHFGALTCISVEKGASRLVRMTGKGAAQCNATQSIAASIGLWMIPYVLINAYHQPHVQFFSSSPQPGGVCSILLEPESRTEQARASPSFHFTVNCV